MNRREFVALAMLTTVVRPPGAYAETRSYRIALLTLYSSESADLIKGPLRDLGYIDGKNLTFIRALPTTHDRAA